jgi:DNA invertase Pin-like site-specific DNA recombinase
VAGSEVKAARVYLRVSTDEQDLTRQESIVAGARSAGFYVAAVYREKASGARPDRPELLRMVADLQPGEVVVAEKIDRISRLPLPEAELLVETIRGRGARLAVPGIVDLSDLVVDSAGVARIVLEAVQDMLLRVALQTARDDYETRRERQREGIEIAKRAVHRPKARPRSPSPHRRSARGGHEHRENCGTRRVQHRSRQARDRTPSLQGDSVPAGRLSFKPVPPADRGGLTYIVHRERR